MKLAKIDHERCHETAAVTYVWVPDDFTAEGLQIFLKAAQELYLKNEEAFKNNSKSVATPGYEPNYKFYPNKTVVEIQEIHAKEVAAYKEWTNRYNAAHKTFSQLLSEVSNGLIKSFYELDPDILSFVSWGHRHGTRIDYGITDEDIYSKDFNAPEPDGL